MWIELMRKVLFLLYIVGGIFVPAAAQVPNPSDNVLKRGRAYLAKGDWVRAQQEFKAAIQLSPKDSSAYHLLGITENKLGNFAKARDLLVKAAELNPTSAQVHNDLGIVELQLERFDQALAAFRRAIALNSRVPDIYFNLGRGLLQLHQFHEAASALERAHALAPQDPEMLYGLVSSLVQLGDRLRLQALLPEVQRTFRQDSDFHVRLARALFQQRLYELSAQEFAFALKLGPSDDGRIVYEQAEAEYLAGKFSEALDHLSSVPTHARREPRFYRLKGSVLGAMGLHKDSNEQFQEAIRLDPDNPENYILYGKFLIDAEDPEDAILLFQNASAKFPENYRVWLGLGMAYKRNHQHQNALEALQKAVSIDPQKANSYSIIGHVLTSMGKHDEARANFHRAMELNPQDYLAPYFYAVDLSRVSEDSRQALPYVEQSLKVNPGFALAYCLLAKIYLGADELANAQQALEKAVQISPSMVRAYYLLGQVYKRLGEEGRAREVLEKFMTLKREAWNAQTALKEDILLERAAADSLLERQEQ